MSTTPNEEAVARSVNREAQAGYQRERDAKRMVEQAAQAIEPFCHSGFVCKNPLIESKQAADAVLVVVAPLLRAEGAAAERERIKAGIEALQSRWHDATPDDRPDTMDALAEVLALVSREAEASE